MKNNFFLLLSSCLFLFANSTHAQEIDYNLDKHKMLIENKGQWDEQILFQSKFSGGNLWVQQHKLLFHLQDFSAYQAQHANFSTDVPNSERYRQTIVQANFIGSNEVTEIQKDNPSVHYYNYFLGNKESKWANNVHSFHKARLKELYSGIDLQIIQTAAKMKYEFHVAPNADPNQILIEYAGQKSLKIDRKGNLIITTELGLILEEKPYVYQVVNGKFKEISSQFQIEKTTVRIKIGNYNKNLPLIIDPELIFATYSGSVTDNFGMTATYGYDGTAYSGGMVYGNAYPTIPNSGVFDSVGNFTGPSSAATGITDVFISKYNALGTQMLWTTFLGGGTDNFGTETAQSMICDAQNNLYVYGSTSSIDFPIVNGYQNSHNGGNPNSNFEYNGVYFQSVGSDIYVVKISSDGQSLMASTYFGGSGNDGISYNISGGSYNTAAAYDSLTTNYGDQFRGEIMLDNLGNCLVGSCTRSIDITTLNPIQAANGGQQDGLIFRLSNDLSTLQFATYFGGNKNDAVYSIKVDSSSNIVFAGGTSSDNLPNTAGKYSPTYFGGKADGFVGKLNPSGAVLSGVTYIGTSDYDQVYFVEIDRNDKVFVTGQSRGGTFPVSNANYSILNSNNFIAKLNADLTVMERSTVYGKPNSTIMMSPSAFLVDRCGDIFVSGWGSKLVPSSSPLTGYPTTDSALQIISSNSPDFHLFVLDRNFASMKYGTYMGGGISGEHVDGGTSRFDRNGVVYQSVCGGCGGNSDFPTTAGAWSNANLSGNCNNVVFKFDFQTSTKADFKILDTIVCQYAQLQIQNTSVTSSSDTYYWDFGNGQISYEFEPDLVYNQVGNYTILLIVTDSVCLQADTTQINISIQPGVQLDVNPDIFNCYPTSSLLTVNSFGEATYFIWSSNSAFSDTLNGFPSDSVITVNPLTSQSYFVEVGNSNCKNFDTVNVYIVSQGIELNDTISICAGDPINVSSISIIPEISYSYLWSPSSIINGSDTLSTATINLNFSQYVYLDISDGMGCNFKDSIWVDYNDVSGIIASATASKVLVQPGEIVALTANPSGYTYQWSPVTGLSNPNGQITEAKVNQDTEFTVIVSDGACSSSAKVKIQVYEYVCDNPFIFVPNAFTPNGDGENDILYVRGAILEKVLFRVFNRWGEMVFETTNKDIGWDGTFRGKLMDPDTYDYYLNAFCIDGQEKIIKGNVTLMR